MRVGDLRLDEAGVEAVLSDELELARLTWLGLGVGSGLELGVGVRAGVGVGC